MTFPLYEPLEVVRPSLGAVHTGLAISLPGPRLATTCWVLRVVPSEEMVPTLGAERRTQALGYRDRKEEEEAEGTRRPLSWAGRWTHHGPTGGTLGTLQPLPLGS